MTAEQTLKRILKGGLKRALQPLTTRVYSRVDLHIEAHVDGLRRQLNETVGELSALRRDIDRTVATVLNALSNQNANSRLAARALESEHARLAEEITRQIEIARKEIGLEARYGGQNVPGGVETGMLET